jgi:uncharacterized membrane protein
MSPTPVILIVCACFAHAGWNLLARQRRDELAFLRRMLMCAVPLGLVVIVAALHLPHSFPARIVLYVVPSGLICGVYCYSLGSAYKRSDFTVVYPVTRAVPVLVLACVDVAIGRAPSTIGWAAMLLVTVGCVLAPQSSYRDFDLRRYHVREIGWVLLTAGAIIGFTVLDKRAQEMTQQGLGSAAIYCALWWSGACVGFLVLSKLFGSAPASGRVGWAMPLAAAAMGLTSYTLVLWAFQFAVPTAYLMAFRQFSIVIGVAFSIFLHKEGALHVRLPATAAIVGGLVLLKLYG